MKAVYNRMTISVDRCGHPRSSIAFQKKEIWRQRHKKTRPRGQRCVLGLKGDIDKERKSLILMDRPTDGYILL